MQPTPEGRSKSLEGDAWGKHNLVSLNTQREKYKHLRSIKTDQSRALLLRENMTLPHSISGVTKPLENHSCSILLPNCSI